MNNKLEEMPSHQEHNGFLNGLLTGVLLGAAGLYFFGTEKGKKLKDELIEAAKEEFPEFKDALLELKDESIKAVKKSRTVREVTKAVEQHIEAKLPEVKEEVVEKLQHLEESIQQAKYKADEMQRDLEKAASRIEHKFFVRKGRTLKK